MRKISFGVWLNIFVAVLAIASVIIYNVNISGEGYFQGAEVANLLLYCVLAIVMLAAAIVLAQMKLTGMAAAAVEIVSGILRIAATVLLTLCLVTLITARVEGLGFIYFSNADVLQEVQTPANMSSAAGTIANMICLGAATVFSMIAAFFNLRKKETQN